MMQVRAVKSQQSDVPLNDIPAPGNSGMGGTGHGAGDASTRHNVSFVSHGFTAIGDKVKELNDTLAELQALGIQHVTNLPELVLVGDQSAGKSSLMSSFSGIYLPRSEGACTRCPVHIRLSASPAGDPWKCKVSLQQDYDYDGAHLHVTRDHPFGPWKEKGMNQRHTKEFQSLLDPSKIEETLRWAQIATLNPNYEHTLYRPGTGDIWRRHHSHVDAAADVTSDGPPIQYQAFFSPNTVALDISAPDLTDLSFYDLPGVFTSARLDEDQYLVNVVENLAAKYIAHKQAIILWAVPMNADPETSSTFSIIRRLKAQSRTIGVMTKADLLPRDPGASSQWMAMLRGEQHAVSHGYFITARPIVTHDLVPESTQSQRNGSSGGSEATNAGADLERQGAFEEAFFNRQQHGLAKEWPECFRDFEARCGVGRLVSYMSQQLGKEFANCLPQITQKVSAQLRIVEDELSQLPDMPPNPELGVRRGLSDFANLVRVSLEGADLSPQLSTIMQRFQSEVTGLKPKYLVNVSSNILAQGSSANMAGSLASLANAPSAPASGANSPFRHSIAIDLTADDDNASVQGAPAPSVNGGNNINNGGPVGGVGASGGAPGASRMRRQHNDFLEGRPDPSTPSKRSRVNGGPNGRGIKAEPLPDYGFSPHSVHSAVYSGVRGRNLFSNRSIPPPPPPSRSLVQVREIISAKSQPGMPNIVAEDVYNFLSMEAVAPWPTYVGQLVTAVFNLLARKLDDLLAEALSGLRGRLIVTKSKQLLRQFLDGQEQSLRDTLLRQCKLESRKLYTLNEETLKRYREDEWRMLSRFRHHHRMKAYIQRNAAAANPANPAPERAPPKAWEDMVDEERAREKVQMSQEMAKLGPEPFKVELEVCAYVRAYYRTASVRFVDTCTLQIVSGLIGEVVEALADRWYLDVELGLVGGEASAASSRPTTQTFLDLMEEDPATAHRRTALKEERERYQRTIESIQRLGDHHLGNSQSGGGAFGGTGIGNDNGHTNGHGGMIIDEDDKFDGQV